MRLHHPYVLLTCAIFIISGCAHLPSGKPADPKSYFNSACGIGQTTKSVSGTVWLKAKSKEASGQFPADVKADASGNLHLEVTNLLGGTEATIVIENNSYRIDSPKRKMKAQTGYDSWGGIPLRWASDLFLGRIPCPSDAGAKLSMDKDGELSVLTEEGIKGPAEQYVYKFKSWAGKPWPESLHWERKGAMAMQVDFSFDDPDDSTGSPRKIEAKSPHGDVKIRWRERNVSK
jgi:hypothetical protein